MGVIVTFEEKKEEKTAAKQSRGNLRASVFYWCRAELNSHPTKLGSFHLDL